MTLYRFYKIICDNDERCYIGQTTFSLGVRWGYHVCHYKKDKGTTVNMLFIRHGIESCSIKLIEEKEMDSRIEALKHERYLIETHQCVNAIKKPYRSHQERLEASRLYNITNKEDLAVKAKERYKANREAKITAQRIYNITNKEDLAVKAEERYKASREAKITAMRLYQITNKEDLAVKAKERYKANREAKITAQRIYTTLHKEEIDIRNTQRATCNICGKEMLKYGLPRHTRKAHLLSDN